MPKKLAILAAFLLLLTGCGASSAELAAPAEAEPNGQVQNAPQASSVMDQTFTAYGSVEGDMDLETAAETAPAENPVYDKAAVSDADYFIFNRMNQTVTDEDGMTLLYEKYCETTFSSADPERSQWINGILETLQKEFTSNSTNLYKYAQEFLEANGPEYFYSYSNYQELGIARHDDAVVSLLAVSSLYSGGAHPNSVQTAYNLDLQNLKLLRLEDVIYEDGAEALEEMVLTGVQAKFEALGEYALFEDYPRTIEQSMTYGSMTPYWYFNDAGLVVFYNQYELGPYAAGVIKVELPYAQLGKILKSEYCPSFDSSGVPGNLVLRGDWSGYRKIPITVEAEGERLLVGVEGRVFQIQLSEIYWLEQTPIMQEILFSASSMGQNDVLELIGGFTDDGRSFAVEFINGQGEQKVYYISADGLSEEP